MQVLAQEEYGLRCLLALARGGDGPPRTIQEIAAAEGLSPEYTAKLLGALRRAGLVRSTRGAAGGYQLARPPAAISAWEAVEALGGSLFPEQFCACHAGARSGCVHDAGCALRGLWQRVDRAVRDVLEAATLADLASGACVPARALLAVDPGADAGPAGLLDPGADAGRAARLSSHPGAGTNRAARRSP